VTSDQKIAQNKLFLEAHFRGSIYFMQKCNVCKFVFDPIQSSQFGGALGASGRPQIQKFTRTKSS